MFKQLDHKRGFSFSLSKLALIYSIFPFLPNDRIISLLILVCLFVLTTRYQARADDERGGGGASGGSRHLLLPGGGPEQCQDTGTGQYQGERYSL